MSDYATRRKFFDQLLTIYGRNPVLEALETEGVEVFKLHLAESNKPAKVLDDIIRIAKKRGAEIAYHDRKALSHISKNQKQDQGVAVDLKLKGFCELEDFLYESRDTPFELIALDSVTNPQNLGMIIRSVCASPMTGLLIPRKGCAKLDSLVIKASAGTLFKAKILRCDTLNDGLKALNAAKVECLGLKADAKHTLKSYPPSTQSRVFLLGNETHGLSQEAEAFCTDHISIPMCNHVESLNVAVTASLIAFRAVV